MRGEDRAVPSVSISQMREIDRLMVEEVGVTLEQMMENAGRALAEVARRGLGDLVGRRIAVLVGPGGERRWRSRRCAASGELGCRRPDRTRLARLEDA